MLASEEELFRIYYYDCPPFGESQVHPISRQPVNFGATRTHVRSSRLHEALKVTDHVAFRSGQVIFNGWSLKRKATQDLLKAPRQIRSDDLEPDLKQKRVDMMIGLDIAWMASKRIVDRLLLVTGDTDFVPAMKFARREGVQVVVITVDNRLRQELREHADEVRLVRFPPTATPTTAATPTP